MSSLFYSKIGIFRKNSILKLVWRWIRAVAVNMYLSKKLVIYTTPEMDS
jgi:hypothetical protein